ncbi:MAG: hypothetical protein AVDCRST_MAG71-1936, partial [uncultured Lysobacter sp.]
GRLRPHVQFALQPPPSRPAAARGARTAQAASPRPARGTWRCRCPAAGGAGGRGHRGRRGDAGAGPGLPAFESQAPGKPQLAHRRRRVPRRLAPGAAVAL